MAEETKGGEAAAAASSAGEAPVVREFEDIRGDGGILKRIVKDGDDESKVQSGGTVEVLYVGYLWDTELGERGDEFDRCPAAYPLKVKLGEDKMVHGWELVLPTMKVGEQAVVRLAPLYGYGDDGTEGVPPHSTLEFEMTLVSAAAAGASRSSGVRGEAPDAERARLQALRDERAAAEAKRKKDLEDRETRKKEAMERMNAKKAGGGKKGGKKGGGKKEKGPHMSKKQRAAAEAAAKAAAASGGDAAAP